MTPRQPLPARRPSVTVQTAWQGHLVTVTVGMRLDGAPAEVFADTVKGGDLQQVIGDACVLISLALQHGILPVALAKSLGRVPVLGCGETAPASPIGAILEVVLGSDEILAGIAGAVAQETVGCAP